MVPSHDGIEYNCQKQWIDLYQLTLNNFHKVGMEINMH